MDFSGFNWLEVMLAASLAACVPFIWTFLFSRSGVALADRGEEAIARKAFLSYLIPFALYVIVATVMSLFIEVVMMMGSGALIGGLFGGFLALAFVLPAYIANTLCADRGNKIYATDLVVVSCQFVVVGAVLGGWA